jgi:hypothetical protein
MRTDMNRAPHAQICEFERSASVSFRGDRAQQIPCSVCCGANWSIFKVSGEVVQTMILVRRCFQHTSFHRALIRCLRTNWVTAKCAVSMAETLSDQYYSWSVPGNMSERSRGFVSPAADLRAQVQGVDTKGRQRRHPNLVGTEARVQS